jgi:transposase
MIDLLEVGMRRMEQRQGLRMLKLRDVLSRWEAGSLSQLEAAELLGMSERTLRRWTRRMEEEGEEGLLDRRLGRRSGRAVPQADAAEVERLYRERYWGFTAKHFHEHLVDTHAFRWGYTWTKTYLQNRGCLAKAPRRGAHRRRRPRRPMVGMMLHQDGSRHAWLSEWEALDLVITLDDATGAIYSAILVEEEGTMSSFRALGEVIGRHGLFCSLYTDRGSHYFFTPEAGGKVAASSRTQVGRALAQLGIEHIAAYSPEARGRCERAFRTLQDRLPKELALAGIHADLEAANRYIREVYVPAHNARFAVTPAESGSAFVPVAEAQWRDLLCIQEERVVAPDNTVAWQRRRLQIPPHPARAHFVRATVRVHEYVDGSIAIFHGPRCLIRWLPGPLLTRSAA